MAAKPRQAVIDDLIGVGVYTVGEASLYGGVSPNKLQYWFFGEHPVIRATFYEDKLLTFFELVAARAINRARTLERPVPLPKIRQAIDRAKSEYGPPVFQPRSSA